ncbi:chemotaxis protein methyltransferase CheR [Rhodanobacter sp. ANJX3]|jgi:chemotaxis protein methyltransferase CheR|uniref:CheR family methyltransferase n=1 Tax=unclassified Rhodanobacter TaxID=2621553 RepID=UPI0015CE54F8|nr:MULTISPECIES: CheR family methyltransferase [unclassified Rhodanobacter]MBB5360739.1 chemotaxis protein methyltransferase CheR [Rhodanobacter sp. ANJX3]NYE30887.1 chemotaxis protein methyltransferase CheR [Rhodanobacter sp. K2T2]
MSTPLPDIELERIEVDLFVSALKRRYGFDFSQYAPASLTRRVRQLMHVHHCDSISALTARLLHKADFVTQVIEGLSVPVSEMFRDPLMFRALREQVLPLLASYPRINVWQAGCAYGQEVYSLAILLEEAGLYERSHIFATDFNPAALKRAHEGIYPAKDAQLWSRNYIEAGGSQSLSSYYSARYDFIRLHERLRKNITFTNHNLVTDKVFCEAHLVLCRNVLIYFSNPLQDRTLALFRDSLVRGGYLCLGLRESLDFAPAAADFTAVDASQRLYRRKLQAPSGEHDASA